MPSKLDQTIRVLARHLCEYCRFPERASELPFVLDHIIARQHGGKTTRANLALCCGFCNRHKGPNVAGIDPQSKRLTPLFNPRQDRWSSHFRWRGARIIGTTAIGRVTVVALNMNATRQLEMRRALLDEGADRT
jgi:hypothetical protein